MKIPQSKLKAISETWFRRQREELAAMLAAGETLCPHGKPLLDFDDLENRLYPDHQKEIRAAMELCAVSPELGGKHVKRVMEAVALELVDEFQDAFRSSYEQELNEREVA